MLTFGVMAYNEEGRIGGTVEAIAEASGIGLGEPAAAGGTPTGKPEPKFEVLVVDDGSTDGTGEKIRELEKKYAFVRSVTHGKNLGMGMAMRTVIKEARADTVCFVPGDNIISVQTLKQYFAYADREHVVLFYHVNTESRSKGRVVLSRLYDLVLLVFFNVNLKYINGGGLYPIRMLRDMRIRSNGYTLPAELTMKCLLSGASFSEIPSYVNPGAVGKSGALRIGNVTNLVVNLFRLFIEMRILQRKKFSKQPTRVWEP